MYYFHRKNSLMRKFARSILDIFVDFYMRIILVIVRSMPGRPGNILIDPVRCFFLRFINIVIGRDSQISPGFFVFRIGNFRAGSNCRFGYDFKVWNFNSVGIGNDLLASHGIKLICGNHRVSNKYESITGPVSIGNNVWLGADVTIVGPCNIGDDVIIGANSFVTGNLMPGWVYAGIPAKPIRMIPQVTKEFNDFN